MELTIFWIITNLGPRDRNTTDTCKSLIYQATKSIQRIILAVRNKFSFFVMIDMNLMDMPMVNMRPPDMSK